MILFWAKEVFLLMTEKDKMLNGELYDAFFDKELADDRMMAKCLCHKYNSLSPDKLLERKSLLKQLFGKTKENFHIEQNFWCDYGYNIEIGENFYANHDCVMLDPAKIIFGDNVFVAPQCGFYTAGHPINVDERNSGLEYAYPIIVGNNVWFGAHVSVMPGVTIGDNVVIGAGSVVTKDIPSNVVAVGNPCKVLHEITEKDKMKK